MIEKNIMIERTMNIQINILTIIRNYKSYKNNKNSFLIFFSIILK